VTTPRRLDDAVACPHDAAARNRQQGILIADTSTPHYREPILAEARNPLNRTLQIRCLMNRHDHRLPGTQPCHARARNAWHWRELR